MPVIAAKISFYDRHPYSATLTGWRRILPSTPTVLLVGPTGTDDKTTAGKLSEYVDASAHLSEVTEKFYRPAAVTALALNILIGGGRGAGRPNRNLLAVRAHSPIIPVVQVNVTLPTGDLGGHRVRTVVLSLPLCPRRQDRHQREYQNQDQTTQNLHHTPPKGVCGRGRSIVRQPICCLIN